MNLNAFKIETSDKLGWKFKSKGMQGGSFDCSGGRMVQRFFRLGPEYIDKDNSLRVFFL